MITTSINSILPPEIIFKILECINSPRADILSIIFNDLPDNTYLLIKSYYNHSQSLVNVALVCKSWTHSAQTLLLQLVIFLADNESVLTFLNAPIDGFLVQRLAFYLTEDLENEGLILARDLLPKFIGVKSLLLEQKGEVDRELDFYLLQSLGLFELEQLTIRGVSIKNQTNTTSIATPFNLKKLDISDAILSDIALNVFITPTLNRLTIMQFSDGDHFSNALRLAAPYINSLYLKLQPYRDIIPYISIIPLCTSVREFHFFFFPLSVESFNPIISAFSINQLLHLKLSFYFASSLPDLLTVLSQPTLRNLQSFTLVYNKIGGAPPDNSIIPLDVVSAECTRRGIVYKYEILEDRMY